METNPYTVSNDTTDQIAEVKMTSELLTTSTNAVADRLQKGFEVIFGPNAKKYGITSANLKLAFMFYGSYLAIPHLKEFLFGNKMEYTEKHEKKNGHWKKALGAIAIIIAIRKATENNQNTQKTTSQS
jgi:hypothetical protein